MAVTREEKAAAAAGEVCRVPVGLVPGHTRRRPQTPPKQRGRHAPSGMPVSAACWRTTRPSQEYYFPHYMRRTDPATGRVTGVVHMAPPSTMLPSVGGCGRRRSLLGTRKACTRPYSQASADAPGQALPRGAPRHLHSHQPHGARRWGDPLRARNAGQRTLPGTRHPYQPKLRCGRSRLADLQAELEYNQRIIADFGTQKNVGDWQQGEFSTSGGVKWFAVGRGQSPRGLKKQEQRPDYIVIDDLDDDEMSHNEERVRQATDWVKQALFGALDVGRGRFLMVGNGFAKHMVLKNIADIPSVKVSKVYAVDSNGSPVWADKWTKAEAEAYADFVGYASWQREMMHNPVAEGGIFKWQWIRYKKILPLRKYDQIICYIDPSFKSGQQQADT